MTSLLHLRLGILGAIFAMLPLASLAQIPNALLHAIPAPPTGIQSGTQLGTSVAVAGIYTVVGASYDDLGASDAGVVKVFHSVTGALLFLIKNPTPEASDFFGHSVAISGSRMVVGAIWDGTGGPYAGSVYVYDLAGGTPTVPVWTLSNPTPLASDSFGWSIMIDGLKVVVGTPFDDDAGASDAGCVYVYDLGGATPTIAVATLNNPAPASGDHFGYGVGLSGSRLVVGARGDDAAATDAGSAYVYDLSSGTPTVPVFTLNNPASPYESLGSSVAVSGSRVVIGAVKNNTGAIYAGRAYVYDVAGGTPTAPVFTLNNPDPGNSDYFGYSVAISGTQVAVGARSDDAGAADAGSAYLYDLTSGTPTVPEFTLNNPTPAANDSFGWALALSATAQLVVGASKDDTVAADAGSAYVYDTGSATPTVPALTLNLHSPAGGDLFGKAVAHSGTRLVVGNALDDTGAVDAGSVNIFDLTSGTPTVPVMTLYNPSPAAADGFGSKVAILGARVLVTALGDDTGASNTGIVYVYNLAGGTPTVPEFTLNNPNPAANDNFGWSLALSGSRVVVGANLDDGAGTDAGCVFVYDLSNGTPTVPVQTLYKYTPRVDDQFGYSVGISGTWIVVASPFDEIGTGRANDGIVEVFDLTSATPTVRVHTLVNPAPTAQDNFGISVGISGTRVVVGTPYDSTGAFEAGSLYVFDLASGSPTTPVATLNNPSPAAYDRFGGVVSISGSRVAVSAFFDDEGASNAGSVYVYDLAGGTPTVPVTSLHNPGPAVDDQFGTSISMDGSSVAVGTPGDDSVLADKGYVYVYGSTDADNDGLRDSWEQSWWSSTSGHGALDDDDQDGIVNLLELAFGLNPTQGNGSALPPAIDEGGYLTLTLTKQPGASYAVQSAGTLLPALPDSFNTASTTVLLDNSTTLKVRDNVPISTATGRFMRTQVTPAP